MQVFPRTISTVFGGERRFVIPLFQRPYVWTEESQWKPLWEDIVDQVEPELNPQAISAPPHFLGAIVIQQRKTWGDELLAHDVIDGQQRLTTFQILLAAFRDLATMVGERQVAAWLVTLTRNPNAIANPEVEQYKIWPTSRDVREFRLVSDAGSQAAIEAVHPPVVKRKHLQRRPLLVEAYIFFRGALEAWLRAEGDAGVSNRCKALRRVLDRQLQLVSIELDGNEDPQVIFETLNARGVPLLASDLLRNYIFQRAGGPEEAERLHKSYWSRFEVANNPLVPDGQRFWEVEESQGRLNRARLDLFVQHYLTLKKDDGVVAISRLYPEYRSWIEGKHPFATVEAELKDFTIFAGHFHRLLRPDPVTSLGRFAMRLRVLDTSTVYPLLLGLLGNSQLPEAERAGIYQDLESFLVRRMICSLSDKNYNLLFRKVLRDFTANGIWTRSAFRDLLGAGTGEAVKWPDDAAFEEKWLTIDAYKMLKPARVEMILRAIEGAMWTSKTESVPIHPEMTIEHIMPQSWESHWPLPIGVDLEIAEAARAELIDDFGNLTLLSGPGNSGLSNGPAYLPPNPNLPLGIGNKAKGKFPAIEEFSILLLNKYFTGRKSWNEQDIRDRGAELFKIAKRVWPGP